MCHSADLVVHHVSGPLIFALLFAATGASRLNVRADFARQSFFDIDLEESGMAARVEVLQKKQLAALFLAATPASPHVANRIVPLRRPVLQRSSRDRLLCSALLGGNATARRKPKTYISKSAFSVCLSFWTGWFDATAFDVFQMYLSAASMSTRQVAGAVATHNILVGSRFCSLFAHYLGGHLFFTCLNLKSSNTSCRLATPVVLGLGVMADCFRKGSENSANFLTCMQGLVNAAVQQKTGTITFAITGHVHRVSSLLAQVLVQGAGMTEVLKSLSTRCIIAFCAGIIASTVSKQFLFSNTFLSSFRFSSIAAVYAILMILHELPRKFASDEVAPT